MPFKTPHPLYQCWIGMRSRCLNPSNKQWKDYGGRGISVCPEWSSFHQFVTDMGPRPVGYSLDRIDNSAGYSPKNCRWATRFEQQMNRRNTIIVTIDGVEYKAADLSKLSGMKADTIAARAAAGLTFDEVMSPSRRVAPNNTFYTGEAGRASGAKKQAQTHCKHGHEFTKENTHITKEGWRNCRACHAARTRRSFAKMTRVIAT